MSFDQTITLDNFEDLYVRFGPMVLRRCRYLLKNEEEALDCMQDVFVRVFERREKIPETCSSFFYTVATRLCLNRIRSKKIRKTIADDELLQNLVDSQSSSHEEIINISIFLDYLFNHEKEGTRNMAIMHYVDGLTLEETAAQMAMSVSGVRKRLAGLRKRAAMADAL